MNPVCPDVIEIFVTLADQARVEQMNFVAQACPPVIAVASLLCEWSAGRSLQELAALTQEDLSRWVGPLPPNKRHAVQLTFLALQELLSPRSFNPVVEGV